MCWNAPVSLTTFLTSSIMCLYLWFRNLHNDRIFSIFIFWFALIQLIEFFMWRNMSNHSIFSKLALMNISLQPVVLVTALFYFYKNVYSIEEKILLYSILGISLIKTVVSAYYAFVTHKNNEWLSVKGPHCHLVWWFNKNSKKMPSITQLDFFYIVPFLLAVLLVKPFSQGLIYFTLASLSSLLSHIFYPEERGSLWCWIANLTGIVTIMMPYLKL